MKFLGIISVDFDMMEQLMIRLFCICRIMEKNESMVGQYISYLWTPRMCMTQNCSIEFGIPIKQIRLVKMCLN